jgi:endonuclease I
MNKRLFSVIFLLLSQSIVFAQSEPAANPSSLRFRNIKHWGFDIAFTKSTADSFLVLKSDQPFSSQPIDGVRYQKGQWIANAKVISTDNRDSFYVREVEESSIYYITVFAYNVSGANTNYKQIGPLVADITTPSSNMGSYYQGINVSTTTFLSDLRNRLFNHLVVSYSAYRFNIQPNIWERDTTNGRVTASCAYSGEITVYNYPIDFGGNVGQYSKEHCLPQSWMLTTGNTTADKERADYFNLLITSFSNANSPRGNLPYGNVVTPTYSYLNFKVGKDANNIDVAEPQNRFKGDVARNMMYEMVCYNGLQGNWGLDNLNAIAAQQSEAVLKLWHNQDPPSKEEKTKLEYIASLQANRNPFIDNPSWVDCINFRQLTAKACIAGVYDAEIIQLNYQWETKTSFSFQKLSNSGSGNAASWELYDLAGKILQHSNVEFNETEQYQIIDLDSYPSGVYILKVATTSGIATLKIPYFNF